MYSLVVTKIYTINIQNRQQSGNQQSKLDIIKLWVLHITYNNNNNNK
jgi:hypothetical protein